MAVLRLLLRLYPASFRGRRGHDVLALIRSDADRARGARGRRGALVVLLRGAADLLVNLPFAWGDAARAHPDLPMSLSLESLSLDARLAFRRLLRAPGFTATAVLTLGLALGAATAVFSLVDQVLLRPLPYAHADRLVGLSESKNGREISVAWPNFEDWRARLDGFDALSAYARRNFTLTGAGDPARVRGLAVTPDLFGTVGVEPELGRFFAPDAESRGAAREVVLTHALWVERYGGDRDVLGRALRLDGETFTVVGVAPAGFRFPDGIVLGYSDLFLPMGLALDPADRVGRDNHAALYGIGRLRPGVQLERVRADLDALSAELTAEYPNTNDGYRILSRPALQAVVGDSGRTLLLAGIAVGLVLLVAAANVSGLFLARGWARAGETDLQRALGAGRARLTRQIALESSMVGGASAVLGLGVGVLAIAGAGPILADLPRPVHPSLDLRAAAFAAAAALALGVAVALLPGLRSGGDGGGARGGQRASGGRAEGRLRDGLVSAEVALAALLLVGAGLLARSLSTVRSLDGGVRSENVLTFSLGVPEGAYDPDARRAFYRAFAEDVEAIPGVTSLGAISVLPFSGAGNQSGIGPVGSGRDGAVPTDVQVALPGYFETMGIPLKRGRLFGDRDAADAPIVAVVDERFARAAFGDEDPIGRQVEGWGFPTIQIVGVVGDVAHYGVLESARQTMYLPYAQRPSTNMSVVVRTDGDPLARVPAIRERLARLDPTIPLDAPGTMEERVADTLQGPRAAAALGSIMAALGALLSVAGVHALVGWAVSRRTREIGVRMALGAEPGAVRTALLLRALRPALLGVPIGLAGAAAASRGMRAWVHGVSSLDPVTYAAAGLGLVVVILVAGWLPALRVTRVDPILALRSD